ncbi:hypothetical protein CEXT_53111, partial [Caerostris extrusa]
MSTEHLLCQISIPKPVSTTTQFIDSFPKNEPKEMPFLRFDGRQPDRESGFSGIQNYESLEHHFESSLQNGLYMDDTCFQLSQLATLGQEYA